MPWSSHLYSLIVNVYNFIIVTLKDWMWNWLFSNAPVSHNPTLHLPSFLAFSAEVEVLLIFPPVFLYHCCPGVSRREAAKRKTSFFPTLIKSQRTAPSLSFRHLCLLNLPTGSCDGTGASLQIWSLAVIPTSHSTGEKIFLLQAWTATNQEAWRPFYTLTPHLACFKFGRHDDEHLIVTLVMLIDISFIKHPKDFSLTSDLYTICYWNFCDTKCFLWFHCFVLECNCGKAQRTPAGYKP